VLADPEVEVYFDTQVTSLREASLLRAIAAGKHVYTEKPTASSLSGALRLAKAAQAAGVTHGVVHDKLFLPGVIKLRRLVEAGFFGRVLSVRLEFGYWVFEGDRSRRSGRRGTTARKTAAGSCSTCSRTGSTC
jgi:predicted dehydrogenase